MLGTPAGDGEHAAALMQGVALVERLCFAALERLGAPVDGEISLTGGATRNPRWSQLRADALGRAVRLPGAERVGVRDGDPARPPWPPGSRWRTPRGACRTRDAVLEPRDAMRAHLDEQYERLTARAAPARLADPPAVRSAVPDPASRRARSRPSPRQPTRAVDRLIDSRSTTRPVRRQTAPESPSSVRPARVGRSARPVGPAPDEGSCAAPPDTHRIATIVAALAFGVAAAPAHAAARPAARPAVGPEQSATGAPEAWTQSHGAGVLVAILDSGVQLNHPDLAGNLWRNPNEIAGNSVDDDRNGYVDDVHGANIKELNGNVEDDNGHGTHVAGIVAAQAGNGVGGSGIAPDAKIMAVKVLDANRSGDSSRLAKGIVYAVDRGAKILNVSINGDGTSGDLDAALKYAGSKGATVVASAGNNSRDIDVTPSYPASSPEPAVLVATATEQTGTLISIANRGLRSRRPRRARRLDPLDRHAARASSCARAPRWPPPSSPARWRCSPPPAPTCRSRRCATRWSQSAPRPSLLSGLLGGGALNVAAALHRVLPGALWKDNPAQDVALALDDERGHARGQREVAHPRRPLGDRPLDGDRRRPRRAVARLAERQAHQDPAGHEDRAAQARQQGRARTAGRSSASTPRARRSSPRRAGSRSSRRAEPGRGRPLARLAKARRQELAARTGRRRGTSAEMREDDRRGDRALGARLPAGRGLLRRAVRQRGQAPAARRCPDRRSRRARARAARRRRPAA